MELIERVERAEAEMIWQLTQVPDEVREQLAITGQRFGQGIAVAVANDPSKFWSKAQGFGFDRPVDSALIGEVLGFYRAAGTAAANFHLAPAVLPADWDKICAEHGLTRGATLVKAVREAVRPGDVPLDPLTGWGGREPSPARQPLPTVTV